MYIAKATPAAQHRACTGNKFLDVFSSPQSTTLSLPGGQVLVAQGEDVESVYRIDRGCVSLSIYTEDGHRRIVSFCGSGGVIGLSQNIGEEWTLTVEAVSHCVISAVPRALLDQKIEADREIRDGAFHALQAEIELRQAHLVMMGVLPATERVYAFLQAFEKRRNHGGFVALPMCRRDIGDYLGLSMETVSRSFTALRESGRIELKGSEKFRITKDEACCLEDGSAAAA